MTDLTEKWKAGELESLGELVKQIEEVDTRSALSDEYLIETDNDSRSEYPPAEEWGYGIVWAMSDYVLPYLKELQALKARLAEHKEYCCCQKNEVLLLENARLKGLLKECQNQLSKFLVEGAEPKDEEIIKFLTKIEEVLK